jgi:hypothetical protein
MEIRSRLNRYWRPAAWMFAVAILMTPLIAMQFTHEVNWNAADFVVMALLLAGLLGALEIVSRITRHPAMILLGAGAAILAFLLIWAELAVGIFS